MSEYDRAPTPTLDRWLPGDPTPDEQVRRMIRVDHAGEAGAVRIYEGQLAVLGKSRAAPLIRHMSAQEVAHKAEFDRLIAASGVRPTLLMPLWDAAGFALGAATAFLGERAAMACTVAVEEAIDEHYARQAEALGEREPELRQTIEQFRAEELEHRDTGLANGAEQAPAYPVLSGAIKLGAKFAIWLAERV